MSRGKTAGARPVAVPSSRALAARPVVPASLEEDIRRRAYEIYEQRGGEHGRAMEDWLIAETEVLARCRQNVA